MEKYYIELLNEIVEQIIETKLHEINQHNRELAEYKPMIDKCEEDLSRIMHTLSQQDRSDLDDYLSMTNHRQSIILPEVYKQGFADCIKLMKVMHQFDV